MSNAFHFDGRLASAPVLTRPSGTAICKFTLIRNEYAGKDVYGFNFIVEDYSYGAPGPKKREQLAKRAG